MISCERKMQRSLEDTNSDKSSVNSRNQSVLSPFCHSSSSDDDQERVENESLLERSSEKRPSSNASNSSSTRRRKSDGNEAGKEVGSKICRICGDKALGYNFNVISCESCKAFFRRNALKKKAFTCPFNNACDVTYVSRRFCQKCRLRKCFEVGMNPDWIMSQEALAAKRRRRTSPNNIAVHKLRNDHPLEHKTIAPAGSSYPLTSSVEPVLMTTDANLAVMAGGGVQSTQQQQFAILTQSGGAKMITVLPVQYVQQSSQALSPGRIAQECLSAGVPTAGTPAPTFGQIASSTQSSSSSNTSSQRSTLITGEESATQQSEEETINIPKSVLINLLTKHHSTSDKSPTRQEQPSAKFWFSTTAPNESSKANLPRRCMCKCTCGVKSNTDPIGVEKSDKMVGTEDIWRSDSINNGSTVNSVVHATSSISTMSGMSSSPSPLGFTTSSGSVRGCRAASLASLVGTHDQHHQYQSHPQQPMYGDVLDAAIASVFYDGNGCTTRMQSCTPSSTITYQHGWRKQLSGVEKQRLEELLGANDIMKEPLEGINEQRIYQGQCVDPKLLDVINMTDIAVRRIIKMNKRIEAFRYLCQEDQIALLKGGCTELMILRGIMTYDPEKDSWLTRVQNSGHEYIKLEVLKGVRGNIYEEHKKYVQSFPAAWRTSEPIMLILGAITLFNSNRPNVVHRDMIKMEEQFYYNLLKSYLGTIYDAPGATIVYDGLVERLDTLHRVNEYAASIFLDINPRDVEPLLIEIFDLKK